MSDETKEPVEGEGTGAAETEAEPVAETETESATEREVESPPAKAAASIEAAVPIVPRTPKAIGIAVVAVVALVALDLWSKHWAEEALSTARRGDPPALCEPGPSGYAPYQRVRGEPLVLVEGMLELEYAENCGAAFSLFGDLPRWLRHGIFYIAALMATLVLSRMFVQGKGGRWFEAAVPMVIAGALGNFHDRVRFGYVVDFIHAHWEGHFDYPVFNVADCAVVIGVIALVIDSYREKKEPAPAPAVTESAKPA